MLIALVYTYKHIVNKKDKSPLFQHFEIHFAPWRVPLGDTEFKLFTIRLHKNVSEW